MQKEVFITQDLKKDLLDRLKDSGNQIKDLVEFVLCAQNSKIDSITYFSKMEFLLRTLLTTFCITHQENYTTVLSKMLETMEENIKQIGRMVTPVKIPEEEALKTAPSLDIKEKHFIFVFLNMSVGKSSSPLNPVQAQCFDFGKNETLAIDKIVLSCFANSNRKNAAFVDMPFWTESDSGAQLIQRINSELPKSARRFNEAGIKLYDTSALWDNCEGGSAVSTSDYLKVLEGCRWYGPYQG